MTPVMIGGPPIIRGYPQRPTETIFVQTNNTGNLAFRYAVFKHLGGNVPVLPWGAKPEAVAEAGDIAVFPCANQLGPHADCTGREALTSRLQVPVLAIGLGAQSASANEYPEIPAPTLRWVQAIAERRPGKAPNITVRGEFTRRVLERMGIRDGVEVLGCPSLFINDDQGLGQAIGRRLERPIRRIGVAAGHPTKPSQAALEKRLLDVALGSGGSYIVQHPLPFIKAARGEFDQLNQVWQNRILDFVGHHRAVGADRGLPSNITVFFDVDAWMEHLRRHDLVVGMRIHGTMLALQAGVPALCLTHDARTEELCETMAVPHVSMRKLPEGPLTAAVLLQCLDFDPDGFDQRRRSLGKRYRHVLGGAGLRIPEGLQRIAGPADSPIGMGADR